MSTCSLITEVLFYNTCTVTRVKLLCVTRPWFVTQHYRFLDYQGFFFFLFCFNNEHSCKPKQIEKCFISIWWFCFKVNSWSVVLTKFATKLWPYLFCSDLVFAPTEYLHLLPVQLLTTIPSLLWSWLTLSPAAETSGSYSVSDARFLCFKLVWTFLSELRLGVRKRSTPSELCWTVKIYILSMTLGNTAAILSFATYYLSEKHEQHLFYIFCLFFFSWFLHLCMWFASVCESNTF